MRIVAVSDLHGVLPEKMPAGDLLLLGGDLCPLDDHSPAFQAHWLDTVFREWLGGLPYAQIVGVAGNHDFVFEREPASVPTNLPWIYLQDSGCEFGGLRIWGSPWQPWFFDWAFNAQPDELRDVWTKIPGSTDILLLHGPPYGLGNGVPEREGVRHTGCPHLLERIKELEPRLVVFGHIHEGRGQWRIGQTRLANVTLLDERYEPVHAPCVFDL